jgi:hypothetical protein
MPPTLSSADLRRPAHTDGTSRELGDGEEVAFWVGVNTIGLAQSSLGYEHRSSGNVYYASPWT